MTAVKVGVRDNALPLCTMRRNAAFGGLYEVAQAAGLGVRIEKEKIVVEDCVPEICQYFGIDPYASISEETHCFLPTAESRSRPEALIPKWHQSSIVGELIDPKKGMILVEKWQREKTEHPIVDPFWRAFYDAMQKAG